jgi:hypothetical protein
MTSTGAMRFALWPNLTQPWADALALATQHDGARHLRAADAPAALAGRFRPFSATFPAEATLPHHVVRYGPDIPNERAYRLLGNVEGKRVLELGCGGEQASIALAHQGR